MENMDYLHVVSVRKKTVVEYDVQNAKEGQLVY
jgi:hypothetical protein